MSSIIEALKNYDPELVQLGSDEAAVFISPNCQGRIFCALNREMVHRLDVSLLKQSSDGGFKNLGGNSLWPAPEGGAFAFNHNCDTGAWYVPDDIAEQPAQIMDTNEQTVHIAKQIHLVNRAGVEADVRWERIVRQTALPVHVPAGIHATAYQSEDKLTLLDNRSVDQFLIAPWSLEQFPGGQDVIAFVKTQQPHKAINFDFYEPPERPVEYGDKQVLLPLGGERPFQVGITVESQPTLLGALDRCRNLLILRRTQTMAGQYFNIADNDQPGGPWSAADIYSVFNGASDGFFELETIAPMQIDGDHVRGGSLISETWILAGPIETLETHLASVYGIQT